MTTTTPAQIKAAYEARNVDGSRNFFNFMVQLHRDTMRSYGVQEARWADLPVPQGRHARTEVGAPLCPLPPNER